MKSVRVWFEKSGLAIYISHLDMNRCFSRAVIRAKLPLWYTEGFNPKPYLNFLCPLALGQEGLMEPLDIRIEGDMSNEEVKNLLSDVMPQGIKILDVTDPVMKTAQITSALYKISLEFASAADAKEFCDEAVKMVYSGEIIAEKRSKRGVKTVNLCEMINSFEAAADNENVIIRTVLPTGSTLNLNPDLLLSSFFTATGKEPVSRKVARVNLLNEAGEIFR